MDPHYNGVITIIPAFDYSLIFDDDGISHLERENVEISSYKC